MKEVIGKYAFEVAVIFIGITASFLFEEWRQAQQKDKKTIEIMEAMVVELERNNQFIFQADTFYSDLTNSLEEFLESDKAGRLNTSEMMYELMEGTSVYRLKDISSFLLGFSSSDQLHILTKNKKILAQASYMESLLSEHENYTKAIGDYSSANLWPLICEYGLSEIIFYDDAQIAKLEKGEFQKSRKDFNNITSDPIFVSHLQWSLLKIYRLMEINDAIDDLSNELNKTIEESK